MKLYDYTYGEHEGQHSIQGMELGPLFLPAYVACIVGALLHPTYPGGPFGASNLMETGPYRPELPGTKNLPPRTWP